MKIKTIKQIHHTKFLDWLKSITDKSVRDAVENNAIITGGSIASLLMGVEVNDFDVYFRNRGTALAVANYYIGRFDPDGKTGIKAEEREDRIRIVIETGRRGATVGDVQEITDPGQIEDTYSAAEKAALETEETDPAQKYRPVFMSTNAITLSNKIQLVIRFFGEPDEIHGNYDFVHCTNYWSSWDNKLVLRQRALEAIMSMELTYIGSKYPLCSIIRLRKFIARGWSVNAGQILKMVLQCNDLNLKDPQVLEEQLTGVDSAYFMQIINDIKDKNPERINTAYLCEIIDRLF
jgi:hypothetical protein